jgi:hypothetical protein
LVAVTTVARADDCGQSGRECLLSIAELTIGIVGDDSIQNLGVQGAKRRFVVRDGTPDARIAASVGDPPAAGVGRMIFDTGQLWQLHQRDGHHHFSFRSPALGPRPYTVAIFNRDFSEGTVHFAAGSLRPGQVVDPLDTPIDELLFSNLLARGRGIEVHACGLVDPEGRGRLFVGMSTAGKTTMARLWHRTPGVTVLSDDRIILRRKGGAVVMYGTPWHGSGDHAAAASAPLTAVYFLKKEPRNRLTPLAGHDAVLRFLPCSFIPYYDAEAVDFSLGFLADVAREVPCHELGVVPDERVVNFIRNSTETRHCTEQ